MATISERSSDAVLSLKNLSKSFDGTVALDGFSAEIAEGTIFGLVGPNGAGKTTMFNVVSGFLRPDAGDVLFKGELLTGRAPYRIARLGVARTFQELRLIARLTALENVMLAFPDQTGESAAAAIVAAPKVGREERARRADARDKLAYVGLGDKANDVAADLSYGQQKLLSLACCFAAGGELLLLDEPVAGVAPFMVNNILGLIERSRNTGKTVVIIEHNFDAVAAVCDRVIFMDQGRTVAEGTPEEVRANPAVVESYLT